MRTLARLNLVVAANITALAWSTQLWWSGVISVPLLFPLMFCGITLAYLSLRSNWLFTKPHEDDGVMAHFTYHNRILIGLFALLLVLISGYLSIWYVPARTLGYFLPVLLCVALYQAPLGKGKRVRHSGAAKLFLISLSVTWVTWVVPTLSAEALTIRESTDWPLGFLARFFFIMGITIPFDVRDLEEDKRKQVKTLAVVTGKKVALRIAVFCCLASLILEILRWNSGGISGLNLLAVGATLVSSTLLITEAGKARGEVFYSWLMEGMPGLMAFLLWSVRL